MTVGTGRALKVFSGNASKSLIHEICPYLDIEPGKVEIQEFANGNFVVKIQENVRECDVFVVQTSCSPVNTRLMELLLMIDAPSACRVTAVLPYFPYVRSDKKDQPRISIAARLVADLLEAAGVALTRLAGGLGNKKNYRLNRMPQKLILILVLRCATFNRCEDSSYHQPSSRYPHFSSRGKGAPSTNIVPGFLYTFRYSSPGPTVS